MKVVILAGGMGTRISEESHLRPKPMIEIGGHPILWHIMKIYSACGFNDFVICCGYRGYMIKEYFANYYLHRSDITFDFSNQNSIKIHSNVAEPWKVTLADTGQSTQTGGRIRRIRKYVEGQPFLMTYGDGVADMDINTLIDHHKQSGMAATLTAIQPTGRYGVLDLDEDKNCVIGFREKAQEDATWINAGFMVLEPDVIDYIDGDLTYFEREPLTRLSANGKLGVYRHYGYWQCMDTQRDKGALERLWNDGNAPWKIWTD
ncbi:MAG: glucose-1-phosphate cytidylyltransferase [Acidobacteriota bacterium]|nr:glucose-1-phosphate cytidylyltransferase [Acidobacteriota bacterium]